MTISRFEELEVWKLARKFVTKIYEVTNDEKFKRDFALRDQLRRASISIISNISEGFEKQSNLEFIRFLYIAKASSGETRAQLYIASDLKYIDGEDFELLVSESEMISKSISGFIKYLKTVKR
ncbi:MAG: four helix bundle protein [Ignavibacteriae bacterium]|nr:four helix bundle protein [Ignavibacteriota bacterium]